MNIEEVISIRQTNFTPRRLSRVLSVAGGLAGGHTYKHGQQWQEGPRIRKWKGFSRHRQTASESQRNELIPGPFDMEMRELKLII